MKRILIADDEPLIRTMLTKLLNREGFDITTACNGKEAIDHFVNESPELVITDLVMPEKEGIELIRELKKINSNLPIIAMSGGGMADSKIYLNTASLLGAAAVFEKPFENEKLLSDVHKLLNT